MTAREYLPADAPFIVGTLFQKSPTDEQQPPLNSSRRLLLSSKGSAVLGGPHIHPNSITFNQTQSNPPSFTQHAPQFSNQANPYLPSSQGLSRYFSAPSVHLSPAGMWMSAREDDDYQNVMTSSATPIGSTDQLGNGMKKRVIARDGQRLPSVLKKALPLPPEDIRSVPHVRAAPRPESPPVVSIGMTDMDGIPIPWRQTPDLYAAVAASSNSLGNERRSGSPADEVRDKMRIDFDNIEIFIEQAFSKARGD